MESEEGDKPDIIYGSLTGVNLQVTTRFTDDYLYDVSVKLSKNGSGGMPEYELVGGYAVDVFLYLQSLLNFTYILRPDVRPIRFDQASVENASIDLYLASFSLLPARAQYVEPTFDTGQSRILAFIDHAFEVDSSNQNILITPFTPDLWLCVLIFLLVFVASFLFFSRYEDRTSTHDIIFHCVSVVLQKDADFPISHTSTKLATVVLSFAVIIMMASYTGILTSIFAVNVYSINSIQALINSNYKIMLEVGSYSNDSTIKYMLQALSNIPSVVTLLRKAEKSKFVFTTFNDAISQVNKIPSAYIIDEETGVNAVQEAIGYFPCTWATLPVFNLRYPWSMYMRKNASFQRPINTGLVIIRERGILNRIRKKWIQRPRPSCGSGGDMPFKSIKFSQVQLASSLLILTMSVVCPLIFLIEKLSIILIAPKGKRKDSNSNFLLFLY